MGFNKERIYVSDGVEIPLDGIKVQRSKYPIEMFGVITVKDKLPFFFRRSRDVARYSESGEHIGSTEWLITHALYQPFTSYTTPELSQFFRPPTLTEPVDNDQLLYILYKLGWEEETVGEAASRDRIPDLYRRIVTSECVVAKYNLFQEDYFVDKEFRSKTGIAINEASEIVLAELRHIKD